MNDSNAALDELTPNERKTLQALRDIKSRPSLLPMSWFEEIDRQVEMVFGVDRNNPLARSPRRQYQVLGRVMGMLVGGALGDSLGATAEAEGIGTAGALLAAIRSRSWRAPNSAALVSAVEIATRAHIDQGEGTDLDAALMTRAREAEFGGTLGCFAASIPAALVSITSPDEDVFRRAAGLARLLSEHPEECASAGAFAVALVRALKGQNLRLDQISEILLAQLDTEHAELRRRLEYLAAVGEDTNEQEVLTELGEGSSAPEVVSRALCLGARNTGGWAEVLHAFAGVTRSRNAQVSGLLSGARHGAEAFPLLWRRKLEPADQLESVAGTFMTEFGPDEVRITRQQPVVRNENSPSQPTDPAPAATSSAEMAGESSPERRTRSRHGEPTALKSSFLFEETRERALGAAVGFAVGERLGSAVSNMSWPEIREQYGEQGIVRYAPPAEAEHLRSSLVRLGLSLDTVIRADRARLAGVEPDLGQAITETYRQAAARIPEFANDVIAESVALYPLDPQVGPSLTQIGSGADEIIKYLPLALWTEIPSRLFALVRQAASASASAEDAVSIAAYVVVLQACISSKDPGRAIGTAMSELAQLGNTEAGAAFTRAEQLARQGITPEEIERLGSGNTAAEAIAIAVCAVLSEPHGIDGALQVAVNHSGNSAITGALCGALLAGSYEGVQRIPEHWLQGLTGGHMLYRLAQDACEQFGPEPRDDAEWAQRYPVLSVGSAATAQPPVDPHERFMGAMLAGAMGDALGFAIEFHDIGAIRREHGDAGLTAPVVRDGVARVSDDTQMMLFTLEGLIRAHSARRIKPVDNDPVPEVQHAYQRWFHTQNQPWERAGGPYAQHLRQPDGWLITHRELFSARAPGSTCMSALARFAQTHQHATPQFKINDSKGCGGVMRAAPVAVWSHDPAEVFYAAVGTAALTHSHPSGYLSAGVLAVIVHQLIRDVSLPDSVRLARDLLIRWRGHEEQLQFLDKAVELARKGPVAPEEIKDTLGQGWVGEEALAIGLYAVLATDSLRDALLLSVNHSGDSDSTGIVCGNIAGALYGSRAIPPEWLATLELRELVETLAKDALVEFSPGPPTDPGWTRRYPAW